MDASADELLGLGKAGLVSFLAPLISTEMLNPALPSPGLAERKAAVASWLRGELSVADQAVQVKYAAWGVFRLHLYLAAHLCNTGTIELEGLLVWRAFALSVLRANFCALCRWSTRKKSSLRSTASLCSGRIWRQRGRRPSLRWCFGSARGVRST